jgi:hypothetical protein
MAPEACSLPNQPVQRGQRSAPPERGRSRFFRLIRGPGLFTLCLATTLVLAGCDVLPALRGANQTLRAVAANPINDPEDPLYRFDRRLSMRGDPDFDVAQLNDEQDLWHERLWEATRSSAQVLDAAELAESDDAYKYGRDLYTHNSSLLLGLRATGDLRFLDEVDRSMQVVRGELYDGWCGGVSNSLDKGWYNTMYGKDGYLNFRRRHGSGDIWCRDVADLEETMVHGHLAMIMYAYHVNRDLASPAGIDYGERADFWLDYLVNHFEAKWRERSGRSYPRMDFIDLKFCHTYNTFLLYYYYLGMRLQDDGNPRAAAYLEQAQDLTDQMFETPYLPGKSASGFIETNTKMGPAVVYTFGSPGSQVSSDSVSLEACPTTYVRYMMPSLVQLRLEGFYRWDDVIMDKIATGLAHFVFDTDPISDRDKPFAAGVTGSKTVAGIPRTEYRPRFDETSYALSSLANVLPWNDNGKIREVSLRIYERTEDSASEPNRVHLPASFLLAASLTG